MPQAYRKAVLRISLTARRGSPMRRASRGSDHAREGRCNMASHPHESSPPAGARREWATRDMWPSLAITAAWVVVFADALYGPDITSSTPGGTTATCPSAVVVALFAFLTSWVVAKYAFRDR